MRIGRQERAAPLNILKIYTRPTCVLLVSSSREPAALRDAEPDGSLEAFHVDQVATLDGLLTDLFELTDAD